MNRVNISRDDIMRMRDIMQTFSDVDFFVLEQDNSSGIGSITTVKFRTAINDVEGDFIVEISGNEKW